MSRVEGGVWSRLARRDPYDFAFALLLAALIVLALTTFGDYSISNDEEVQHRYGELIIAYYTSGFSDRAVFDYNNLYLYGGLFDIVAVLLARILPFDPFSIRHVLSAFIGIGGIAAAGATARLIAGPRAGLIAAATLALCGAWYGAMFNHTKDIPFAAAMMAGTYFLCRIGRDLPKPRSRDLLGYGLMLGAALGLRALGLLLVGYAFVAIGLHGMRHTDGIRPALGFLARPVLRFVPAFALAYAIMLAAWPWAALDPLNPVRGLFAFAQFHYDIRTIIFDHVYRMAEVPWWYVPAYLAIKLTLLMLIGAALALLLAARQIVAAPADGGSLWRRQTAFVAFTALFPLFCEVISEGPAFTGMRHFLFLAPPLAVLTGLGIDAVLSWLAARHRAAAAAAMLAVVAVFVAYAVTLARLHPYEYLFYNPLVGGLQGAAGRFEMDYWVNSMAEAVRGLETYLDRTVPVPPIRRYLVGVCGERFAFEHYASPRLIWSPGWLESDFFIAPTHMGCDRVILGKTILSIERLGVVIGVVKDRRGFNQRELLPGR